MSTPSYRELTVNGLWKNNPALVQLLGLCPLLGVSNSAVNALGLGLATMLVLTCSNIGVSLVRGVVNTAVRLPAFVMIIAALTTCIELLMQAFTYELYQILGIFIPLITTNCVILGRADGFAAKHNPLIAGFDGLVMGIGFCLVLVVLGGLRELFGTGALFANMHLLFGPVASDWQITLFSDYKGLSAGHPAAWRLHCARPADRPEEPHRPAPRRTRQRRAASRACGQPPSAGDRCDQ